MSPRQGLYPGNDSQVHSVPVGRGGAWDAESGDVPPLARNALVTAEIDPDDAPAVFAFYSSGYYADPSARPYWLGAWTDANLRLERLP